MCAATTWRALVWHLSADAYSGTAAITSTLSAPYSNFESKTLELNNQMDLLGADKVIIQYYAKWDLERSFDYVQLEASINGVDWMPLCGKLTKPGVPYENNTYSGKAGSDNLFQPDNEDLYDGDTQDKWALEEIIIDNESNSFFLNESTVYLRFNFKTDSSNSEDIYNVAFAGFTFDDFKYLIIKDFNVAINEPKNKETILYPNPSTGQFLLDLGNLNAESMVIYDIQGREVMATSITNTQNKTFELAILPGLYFVCLKLKKGSKTIKLIMQ